MSKSKICNWLQAASAWGPVVAYMACIYLSSAQPQMLLEGKTSVSDKTLHTVAYFGLALLAYRAAAMVSLRPRFNPGIQSLTVAVLYGVWDEGHQHFVPGRTMELGDLLADAAGALIAVTAIVLIRTWMNKGGKQIVRRRERL